MLYTLGLRHIQIFELQSSMHFPGLGSYMGEGRHTVFESIRLGDV